MEGKREDKKREIMDTIEREGRMGGKRGGEGRGEKKEMTKKGEKEGKREDEEKEMMEGREREGRMDKHTDSPEAERTDRQTDTDRWNAEGRWMESLTSFEYLLRFK